MNEDGPMNQTVIKLGFISFFADIASEMLYPITPIFLTTLLGVSMSSLGLIEGIAEATASLLKTFSGSWSDRAGTRKPFIFVGYFLGAISKPLIGVSSTWIDVLFARGLDRTGKGIRSAPRDALIADSVGSKHRGTAFGFHRAMDTVGAAVGPLLALYLLRLHPGDLRSLYFWALIPGLFSVVVVFALREKKKYSSPEPRAKPVWKNPCIFWRELDSNLKKYFVAWGLFSVANSSDVFLLLKAKSSGFTTERVILLYCVYNLTSAASSVFFGTLSDRIDRKKIMIAGLVIFALVYTGFSFAESQWMFWILFFVYGTYVGATDGVGKALAVDFSPKDSKGTTLGILGTITGITTVFASVIAGLLWDHFGPGYAFLYGAAGASVAALMLTTSNRGPGLPRALPS